MSSESSFSKVLRGYDPEEVDTLVQKLRIELLTTKKLHDEVQGKLSALEQRLEDYEQNQQLALAPTSEGVHAQVNKHLKKADELAAEIISRAEADALLIRSSAERNAQQMSDAAQHGYDRVVDAAREDAHRIMNEAQHEAQRMIAHATTQADIIIEDAKEESKLIRGEASTFVLNQKAEATNQIELERAQAQKSLDEMRLILATQAAPKVISQKIMALLSENAENSAQNTKRSEEIEARHREAVLNTDNYISSVQIQLSTAKTRLREVEEEASQRTAELKKELQNLRLSAHKEAEAIIAAAEKQSRQKMADSDKYVAAVLKTIYEHIASLKLERESLIQYFDALQLELEKTLKTTTAGTSSS